MSSWLDPLRARLDNVAEPVTFFFRDDDAGWGDDRLERLLDVFEHAGTPLDIAAIPAAVSPATARLLEHRHDDAPELVRIHQHGSTHRNHEPSGRKCEFGPSRSFEEQLGDVRRGRDRLQGTLAVELDPVFTPPWNRCTTDTALALRAAGFEVLSREARAEPLGVQGLRELPVSVDWVKQCGGARIGPAALGELIVAAASCDDRPAGVMLHHAVMDEPDLERLAELLVVLDASPSARTVSMKAAAVHGAAA